MRKTIKASLWGGAVLGLASVAIAAPKQDFTGVYTFGDEFTSQANSWGAYLSQRYGVNAAPGRANFAQANALSTDLPAQRAAYNVAVRSIQPDALYAVYMGPRDFVGNPLAVLAVNGYSFHFLGDVAGPGIGGYNNLAAAYNGGRLVYNAATFPAAYPDVANRAAAVANFVQGLNQGGAETIVVFNHFNEALRSQGVNVLGARVGLGALVGVLPNEQILIAGEVAANLFNQGVARELRARAPSANIVYLDYKRLVEDVSRRAAAYFSAAELALAHADYPFFSGPAGETPHAAAHKLSAQYLASVLESPSQVALLREIPLQLGSGIAQRTRLLASSFFLNDVSKGWTIDAGGDFSKSRTGSFTKKELGFQNAKTFSGEVLANYRLSKSSLVGLRLSHAHSTLDFVANKGGANIKETALSIHGAYQFKKPFFIYGSAGAGMLEYGIERKVTLGKALHKHKGTPNASHYFAAVGAGYRCLLHKGYQVALTPFVSGSYQDISIQSYTENGSLQSTTMSFNLPKRQSVVAEIGASLDAKFRVRQHLTLVPAISIAYARDFKDPIHEKVRGRVSDMPREFSVPAYKVDPSSVSLQGQVMALSDGGFALNLHGGVRPSSRVKTWNVGLALGLQL